MHLSRLIVRNYRSIKNVDIAFEKGKNVVVGRNNTGKSNIVRALDVVLGENSPTYQKYENISDADFFSWKEREGVDEVIKHSDNIEILCFLSRDADEDLNFDSIDSCMGFYKLLDRKEAWNNVQDDIEKRFDLGMYNSSQVSCLFEYDKDESDPESPGYVKGKRWIDAKLKNQRNFRKELSDKFEFLFVFKACKKNDRIVKELRFLYRESPDANWIMALSAPIRNELLQSAIVASFRDPQNQLRISNYTWYGKLMRHLTSGHGHEQELTKAHQVVRAVSDKIFDKAKENVQGSALEVAFPNAEIFFQLNEDIKSDIYKDCKIYIDDGVKSPLTDKGSGIQSATIIGLFNLFVSKYNTKTSALLCIEEPELYLHPHARRVISNRLDDFLQKNKNQVIATTHSSEFISTTQESLNIILVRNYNGETSAKNLNVKSYKSLLVDNNYNEIFFADKVILCEGYDNYVVKWIANSKYPEKIDAGNISIINVAGKDRIIEFVNMILQLGIDCYVFADFDFFLRDKDKAKSSAYGAKNHDSIETLGVKYFEQNCIYGKNGKKNFSSVQKFRSKLKKEQEELFYTAKHVKEFNDQKFEEGILKLRKNGIGILNGEIEDLSKDTAFISSVKKISLNTIFEINKRINSGEKISNLFETEQIEEFLDSVLSMKIANK